MRYNEPLLMCSYISRIVEKKRRKDMKLKTFEELLRENNVKKPLFLKKRFKEKWLPVAAEYEEYCAALERRNAHWEKIRDEFAADWEKEVPTLEEMEPVPTFRFDNYKQAEAEISKARKEIKARLLMDLKGKLEIEARTEWLEEILKKADEKCRLIVIKGDYEPNAELIARFNSYIAQKKACSIQSMISTVWIAFNPKAHISVLDWGMKKASSTVEYIS